jgi:hypothetical protein
MEAWGGGGGGGAGERRDMVPMTSTQVIIQS